MLEAHNIAFGYQKDHPLFTDFSIAVEPGERVALLAPSGFGKTTLARLLSGYEQPWSGSITCDGELLSKTGICPVQLIGQHPELAVDPRLRMERTLAEAGLRLDETSLKDNELGSKNTADASVHAFATAEDLLEALGIRSDWLRRYPHELSGGELQRFCIARAVAVHTRYLIADEISTMLDAVTQAQIWHVLLEWQQACGAGIVFVSHSPALVDRLATRVVDLQG